MRWQRRLVKGLALALVAAAVLAIAAFYLRLDRNLSTFDPRGIGTTRPQVGSPDAGGDTPVNILMIGSDSRAGSNQSLGGGSGGVGRSDTTVLLHVDADHRHAVAVSIPRDTLVDIPACLLPDRTWSVPRHQTMFNEAFTVGKTAAGNPACTQNTVEQFTGLRVDHTMVVDFAGFATMTSAVGGVEVCVPKDVYARDLNPNRGSRGRLIFGKGPQKVSGKQALDYVRVRHGLGDGSDIGRIERQQAFLASLATTVRAKGMNPTALVPLADAATRSLTVDPGLGSTKKLVSFAMSMRRISLNNVRFVTVPWRFVGSRVALRQPAADHLWATLKADRIPGPQTASRTASPRSASGSSGHRIEVGASTSTPTATPGAAPTSTRTATEPTGSANGDLCSNLP